MDLNRAIKVSDIFDMLEKSDDETSDGFSENSAHESDDEENEEITEKLVLEQQENIQNEKNTSKHWKELLPIKTKGGVVPRSMEAVRKTVERAAVDNDDEVSDRNDEVKQKSVDNEPPAKKKKFLTASELLCERQDEFNRQKFRIGKICSAITEKPEERVGSFKALLGLVQEVNEQRERNLVSVRKLAMLSIMEAFKDIIPDYKIGVTDLQNQKVKKDTLARVTFENELLKYFKKYLCQLEACAKALKPGKYAKRPTREEIYMAEVAVQCLCELLLAHTYSNYSTNIAQVLVIYLNCYNASVRKRINETLVTLFKTDKRLDLSRHVSISTVLAESFLFVGRRAIAV